MIRRNPLALFFDRRKPAPPLCTPDNIQAYGISPDCIARSEQFHRNTPETPRETWVNDNKPDRLRGSEGQ